MSTLVHCDGKLVAPEDARVSVFDRSFLYGDSVYETLRTYGAEPFDLERHLARLAASMRRLRIDAGVTLDEIARRARETLLAAKNPESYIRIVVSRGVGEFGLAHFEGKGAVYVIVRPFTPPDATAYARGLSLVVAKTRRVAKDALDPGIKSGNYLNSLMALMEAKDAGADDAVMINERGFLTEASTSSLFVVRAGEVLTPPLSAGILDGVTRFHALAAARAGGLRVTERDLAVDELRGADEIFLTSTLKEVMGVSTLDGKALPAPLPGPVTARVHALLRERIRVVRGAG